MYVCVCICVCVCKGQVGYEPSVAADDKTMTYKDGGRKAETMCVSGKRERSQGDGAFWPTDHVGKGRALQWTVCVCVCM